MLKHLDLSQFTLNEKMYIENANIQNCKISEFKTEFVSLVSAIFITLYLRTLFMKCMPHLKNVNS